MVDKRRLGDDRFTLEAEAAARAWELGFEGETHVHASSDGEAQFMPGPSHAAYLVRVAELQGANPPDDTDEEDSMPDSDPHGALRTFFETAFDRLVGKGSGSKDEDEQKRRRRREQERQNKAGGAVLKVDEEEQIVWGWASVITEKGEPVVDTQGDVIEPSELLKATTEFMTDVRTAKAMHQGDQVGEVIHSLPLTYELAKSLGIETEDEGWIVAMKIHDTDVWERVKAGELAAFSIGGVGVREELS